MGRIVNQNEFATLVGRSRQTVSNWITQGLPAARAEKRGAPVKIDTEQGFWWLVEREVESRARVAGKNGTKADEELRLLTARADSMEVDAALKRETAVDAEILKDRLFEIGAIFSSQADAIAGRLASQLPGDPGENRKLILGETRRIRELTADKLIDYARSLGATAGGAGEPSAQPDA